MVFLTSNERVKLRDCVAYNMNEENLQKLSSLACDYFTALISSVWH